MPKFVARSLCWLLLAASAPLAFAADDDATQPEAISEKLLRLSGVQGGFIVHVGCGEGQLTSALRAGQAYQVHGLDRDPATVRQARQHIQGLGSYGGVSVDVWQGQTLPYVDHLVNLLVVEDAGELTRDEMLRVIVPDGVLLVKTADGEWEKAVKPRSERIDDWTHFLHDPSGNAVAHDDEVGPPQHLQWVGSPRWSRHHDRMASMSALVSTGGRMFYVMDEGSRISIQLPSRWKLIARDAFNGTILWKRDISSWHSHLWPLKSGPTQLARRLVAIGDEVYATLGFAAPLVALDAATGATRRTYEGSDATEEVVAQDGLLFLVINKGEAELKDYLPLHGTVGDQKRIREEFFWNEEPRVVMAYDAESGKQLWARQSRVSPLTLAADDKHVYFHDGERLNAVHRETGEVAWTSDPANRRKQVTFNFGPRLVVQKDVILFAGGDNRMSAYAVSDGKHLWTAEHPNSGYQSPQDLMVVNGLVWCAPLTSGKDSGVYVGRDPLTGEVKQQFAPNVDTYWFHHRCYISKATDKFFIPSRTGIEFVDHKQEQWDINHWVRGGCLYGVMPCNGLVYAPPHDCACYPEAKLFGFNALAPAASTRPVPREIPETGRLERGPAYNQIPAAGDIDDESRFDWPTYRRDASRSGATTQRISSDVATQWTASLGGTLTAPVIADGRLYVAQKDQHTLHVLDANSGDPLWTYTIGARIDSPPTVAGNRVVFGGADGYVYCLRAEDGALAWRYRAAPEDRRTMAYEQLESLWPVHGSVLIQDDVVWCVAGRSVFLDGGLRLIRLNLTTGEKLSEMLLDDKNPETGGDLQERLQVLQMPVGLPDILSSVGDYVFMRSQKFDQQGNRLEIGPISGDFPTQGSAQTGPGVHLFAPMGFLDDSWFHRAYWVMGRNFAGGHAGYFQAGKFAPSGRILVNGDGYVYGYGRKPEYLRWTTTLEHQLFAASSEPPAVDPALIRGNAGSNVTGIGFPKTGSLNPQGKPLTVEAWINATRPNGVIIARGGPADGFALSLSGGKPRFDVRGAGELSSVTGPKRIVGEWHHVAGVLTEDKHMRLYVDGELVAEGPAKRLIAQNPAQTMEIGADGASAVGEYQSPNSFTGRIDQVRLAFAALNDAAIRERFANSDDAPAPETVLSVDFNDGTARDLSRYRNNGTIVGGEPVDGRFGRAMKFAGRANRRARGANNNNDTFVKQKWTSDVPIYVRALLLAERTLFMVGPPDVIDEEETFEGLTTEDPEVAQLLAKQDQFLEGAEGGQLLAIDAETGETKGRLDLAELPVWDGLAAARGKLYLSTLDGKVMCFGEKADAR